MRTDSRIVSATLPAVAKCVFCLRVRVFRYQMVAAVWLLAEISDLIHDRPMAIAAALGNNRPKSSLDISIIAVPDCLYELVCTIRAKTTGRAYAA